MPGVAAPYSVINYDVPLAFSFVVFCGYLIMGFLSIPKFYKSFSTMNEHQFYPNDCFS